MRKRETRKKGGVEGGRAGRRVDGDLTFWGWRRKHTEKIIRDRWTQSVL